MDGFRNHAKRHGKLTPKMEEDMEEIEAMMENMDSYGSKFDRKIG